MLKLKDIFSLRIIFIFIFLLATTSIFITYISINIDSSFHILWFIISVVLVFFSIFIFYFFYEIYRKIDADITEVKNYLHQVSDKNYEAVIKTKHFSECLEIELLLKNIIKRLHKKDTKK